MKAIFFIDNEKVELRDTPVVQPKSGEYLIRITACGLCGSDFEGFLGKTGRRIPPMIMGHECAGVVEQGIPSGKYKVGDQVAIFPKFYCGECEDCKRGLVNLCPNAEFLGVMDCNGTMAEYCCAAEKFLIPFEGDDIVAAMAEPAAVAFSAVNKISAAELDSARNILVVGAGTIGMLVLLWLKYRGAKNVIMSDMSDFRLDMARELGADAVINPMKSDFVSELSRITDGAMCDFSIEAVGIGATAASSLLALRSSGTAIWVGNAEKDITIDMQRVVTTQLEIRGSYIYNREDFDTCVDLLARGEINVKPLISALVPLERGTEAFEMLQNNKDGKVIKIVITNP